MRWFYQTALLLLLATAAHGEVQLGAMKAAPTRPSSDANVVVEDQDILDTCDAEQICVQGRLFNNGSKSAYQVRLRVEVGAIHQGKPKAVVMQKVDSATMAPGDRQEFYFSMDRKIPVKNSKGQERTIEMGRYNFRIVPVWTQTKPKPAKKPKAHK